MAESVQMAIRWICFTVVLQAVHGQWWICLDGYQMDLFHYCTAGCRQYNDNGRIWLSGQQKDLYRCYRQQMDNGWIGHLVIRWTFFTVILQRVNRQWLDLDHCYIVGSTWTMAESVYKIYLHHCGTGLIHGQWLDLAILLLNGSESLLYCGQYIDNSGFCLAGYQMDLYIVLQHYKKYWPFTY